MPPILGHRLLMLHFLLHNGPHYQTGTRGLITSSPSLTALLSEMLGPSGLQGSCCNANIHCYSSSKLLCTLCTDVASQRPLSIFAFRAVRKIHPIVPAAVHATLANGNSPSVTPLQGYPVNCLPPPGLPPGPTPRGPRRPSTTCYAMATGFLHLLEPQASLPARYPSHYANCLADH